MKLVMITLNIMLMQLDGVYNNQYALHIISPNVFSLVVQMTELYVSSYVKRKQRV